MQPPISTRKKAVAVGVDVGGHGVKAVCIASDGSILRDWRDHDPSPEGRTLDAVLARIDRAVMEVGGKGLPIGVAVPGFFDQRRKVVVESPNFPTWRDVPLAALLRDRLGAEVVVENDANAAVVGEARAGAACGLSDVVMLTLGTGVGTGFLVNGGLVRGARGAAGEGGHVVVAPGGRPCGCGGRGCLETYASGPGLVGTAGEIWSAHRRPAPPTSPQAVFELATAGDPSARAVVQAFADMLAAGITALVHVFAPQAVVLGGGVAEGLDHFRAPLEAALRERVIAACAADIHPIRAARLGGRAGALGAAWLAISEGTGAEPRD